MNNLYQSKMDNNQEIAPLLWCPCEGGCTNFCKGKCTGTCSGSCAGNCATSAYIGLE